MKPILRLRFIIAILFVGLCLPLISSASTNNPHNPIVVGAERIDLLRPLIKGKRIGIVSNHTGRVGDKGTLLPDTLLALGENVVQLYSPEHGFRGVADAGATVKSGRDKKTGLPIISLYGKNKKPTKAQLKEVDILLFDLQDVGTRFYTYISTLHYVMEAATESDIPLVVLDRPNPNDFIDGPLLDSSCRSFIGMHPIPVLHGLTVGELALMINGEGWMATRGKKCALTVIPVKGWEHGDAYTLPVPPSPNLKDANALRLYPSLCFFEATIMSVGRGTEFPFTCLGYPDKRMGTFSFIPKKMVGASSPKHLGKRCYGEDFRATSFSGLNLQPILQYHSLAKSVGLTLIDRKRTFDLLAGTSQLRTQITNGWTEERIRSTWEKDLAAYRELREHYLIYPDRN